MGFMDNMNESITSAHDKGERIIALLEDIEEGVAEAITHIRADGLKRAFRRIPLQAVADATGVATMNVQVPPGVAWNLVSAACSGSAAGANTGAFIYLGSNDPINLVHVFNYALRFSEDFAGDEYVPAGQAVIVEFVGQTPGQLCTANLKVQNLSEN